MRLRGKASADQLRKVCIQRLDPESPLIINMAGVRAMTAGFANECFGKLILESHRVKAKVRFSCIPEEIQQEMLSGIRSAIQLRIFVNSP